MGSNPLAALSTAERDNYRTALTALVYQAFYRSWQRDESLTLEDIVDDVRDADEDAPLAEIHRAVARLERTGLVNNIAAEPDLWQQVDLWDGDQPRPTRSTATECGTRGCMRSDGHPGGHLPDATDRRLSAELVIHDGDLTAAWAPGSPWVRIYADAATLAARAEPLAQLPVPHTLRFTPDALVDIVTAWLNQDHYTPPAGDTTRREVVATPSGFVFTPGVETGTLVVLHAEYFAVWRHDTGQVEFYDDIVDWDDGLTPQDTVPVAADVPFTGSVLDQICGDWLNRVLASEKGNP